LLTVFDVVSDARQSKLPPELASSTQNSMTVPQFAVGDGNVIVALLDVCPLEPLETAVVVAP
jgi:hypothetical protein